MLLRLLAIFAVCVVIVLLVKYLSIVLLPFIFGYLLAYFLDPVADKLEAQGMSRTLSTLLILFTFFIISATFLLIVGPLLYEQFLSLIKSVPDFIHFIINQIDPLLLKIEDLTGADMGEYKAEVIKNISQFTFTKSPNILSNILQSGFLIINIIALLLVMPIVTFYLLKDWDKIIAKLYGLLPLKYKKNILTIIKDVDSVMSGYLRGQTNVCFFLALFYMLCFTLAKLKFGLLIGLMSGLLSFVPYIGIMISMVIGLIIAFFQFGNDFSSVLLIFGIFMIGQFIEGNFVSPKLVGDKVGLHPVLIILSLLVGGSLFGFMGILFAIPIAAIIGVLLKHLIAYYLKSKFFYGDFNSSSSSHSVAGQGGIMNLNNAMSNNTDIFLSQDKNSDPLKAKLENHNCNNLNLCEQNMLTDFENDTVGTSLSHVINQNNNMSNIHTLNLMNSILQNIHDSTIDNSGNNSYTKDSYSVYNTYNPNQFFIGSVDWFEQESTDVITKPNQQELHSKKNSGVLNNIYYTSLPVITDLEYDRMYDQNLDRYSGF